MTFGFYIGQINYSCFSFSLFAVLGIEHGFAHVKGKNPTTEPHPQF